ncbi:hypothetical protein FDECE_11775 [Fusarium decemcellulare]|nr:hypothetical protein FDECE_11775 [Fusarium decemcellulare]
MWSHRFTVPRSYLLPFLAASLFVIQLGLSLGDLPSIKLMQDIVCKHHYEISSDELLPEEKCRGEAVQQKLNTIAMGILVSLTISGALVAFPLGVLADRIGRLPILGLSILSMLLSQAYAMFICWQWNRIPFEAIWGLGVPLLLGGGRSIAEAMVFSIIADIVPDKKRATWFQWIVAAVLSGQLLGPVFSRELIKPSIWMPLWMSLGLVFVGGVVIVVFAPETLDRKSQVRNSLVIGSDISVPSLDMYSMELPKETPSAWATLRLIFTRPMLWLFPGAVMSIPLATIQSDIAVRLMPIQFSWGLDHSILLISLRSLATLVTLCVLLPGITYCWTKLAAKSSPHRRDSILARASSLLFLTGSMFMMMVTDEALIILGLVISATGSGLPTLCRAMLVSATGEERAGTMFGMLAAWEVLGFLGCEIGMGALFGVGMTTWIGMPFGLGMLVAVVITVTTWLVPTRLATVTTSTY